MPSVSVRLSKSQIDDLLAMCGLKASGLNRVAEALERMKPRATRFPQRIMPSDPHRQRGPLCLRLRVHGPLRRSRMVARIFENDFLD